jgi:peptidoglycan hydrolase-like protein with peptidoglycan-binding domain
MRSILRLCLMMTWLFAALLPASGANVIFYSKADNSYGWCAGYSYGRGESCARQNCLEYGSGCELAIECDGGWSATAFAPDPYTGFGASCEWQNAGIARGIALLSCIYASRSLCSTSEAFDGNARSTSEKANGDYDLAWYTQSLLVALGYEVGEVDGQIGRQTRDAIEAFQRRTGIEVTGEADWPLMWLMLYAAGGTSMFVADVIAEMDGADQHIVNTYTYRYASSVRADTTLGAELAGLDAAWQQAGVSALLAHSRAPCTLPVESVVPAGMAESWNVTCAEGTYLVALDQATPSITSADGSTVIDVACLPGESDPGPSVGPGAERQLKPSTNTINGANPAFAAPADDCTDTPSEQFKPSNNTINGVAPGLGAAAGN